MEHKGTKTLENSRLLLRPFTMEDGKAMYQNWASDDEVTRYLTWPSHKCIEISELTIKSWIEQYESPSYYQWAIVLKDESSEPIGCIGVVNKIHDEIQLAHIGYVMGKKWWHKGIMSEALSEVIHFLFTEVGIKRIEARHDPRNPHSGDVMIKCGMIYEGTLRQSDMNNQGICDASYYGLLASEYQKRGNI